MDQSMLDRAVKIATNSALNGRPVRQIVWIPPTTASSDPGGSFVMVPCRTFSAADTLE